MWKKVEQEVLTVLDILFVPHPLSTPTPTFCSVPWEADICRLDHITQAPLPSRFWASLFNWQGRGEEEERLGFYFPKPRPAGPQIDWAVFLRPQVPQIAPPSQFSFLSGSKNSSSIHPSGLKNRKGSLPLNPSLLLLLVTQQFH